MTAPTHFEATLRAFADRLFVTGGVDPGDAAIALPPARLALYRDLLRGNYRGMLRFGLTYSFALMDLELAGAAGADGLPACTDAIVARFLEVSPSRTHSSREIADRFMAFLPREFPKLVARRPDLADLMTLERAELGAMFEADDPGRCLEPAEIDALAAGALDDLLALTVVRAPSASIVRTRHAVVALRAALERGEAPPPLRAVPETSAVSRGRPPRFGIEFAVLADEAALVLESAEPGVPIAAEKLAAKWFAALPEPARSRDDEWKAGVFAAAAMQALRAGFLRTN